MEGPHISIFASLFSGAYFIPIFSFLGKRDIFRATCLCSALVQFQNTHSLWVDDLERGAPTRQKPSMGTWHRWQKASFAPFSRKMQP